ncbi:hypothetical protein Tco_1461502 [Tanacetum coccineum]
MLQASQVYRASISKDVMRACSTALSSSPAAKLSLISNLWEDQALFRGGKSASRMVSLQMGDGGSHGDGILGRGDDKGDSGDGDGDGGVGATSHASTCASKDDGKGI